MRKYQPEGGTEPAGNHLYRETMHKCTQQGSHVHATSEPHPWAGSFLARKLSPFPTGNSPTPNFTRIWIQAQVCFLNWSNSKRGPKQFKDLDLKPTWNPICLRIFQLKEKAKSQPQEKQDLTHSALIPIDMIHICDHV